MITGRLLDEEGRSLAKVRVVPADLLEDHGVRGIPVLRLASTASSDAEGMFRLPGVPMAGLSLRFEKPGYVSRVLRPVGKETPLEIVLRRAVKCSGRLVDRDGAPVAGTATLIVESGDEHGMQVGEDGRFLFWTDPGLRYRVRAEEPGGGYAFSGVQSGQRSGLEITGEPLWRHPSTVRVPPGGDVSAVLHVELGLLRVDIEPFGALHRASASHMGVWPLDPDGYLGLRAPVTVQPQAHEHDTMMATMPLEGLEGPLWLLAPPGQLRLHLVRPSGELRGGSRPDPWSLPSAIVDLEVGQENRIRLLEPERPATEVLSGGR